MKRLWKMVGIGMLVTILGVVAVGAVAYAQDGEVTFEVSEMAALT